MKKIFFASTAFLVIAGAVLFATNLYINSLLDLKNVENLTKNLTGAPIHLESRPEWSFFPPAVTFGDLSWRNETDIANYDVHIEKGKIAIELLPLLKKMFIIREVQLFNPHCSITLKNEPSSSPSHEANFMGNVSGETSFSISKLNITGGKFIIKNSPDSYQLDNINLTAKDLALDKDINLNGNFTLRSVHEANLPETATELSATLRFTSQVLYFKDAILSAHTISKKANGMSPLSVRLDGELEYAGLIFKIARSQTELGRASLSLAGACAFSPLKFAGKFVFSLRQAIERKTSQPILVGKGAINYAAATLDIPDFNLSFLGNEGNGTLKLDFSAKRQNPLLDGWIKFARFTILSENSSQSAGDANETASEANMPETAQSFGWLPDLKINLDIDKLSWSNIIVENIRLPLTIQENVIRIGQAEFEWAGGKAEASAAAELNTGNNELRVVANNLDMGKALEELGLPGVDGGNATLAAHLSATGYDWESMKGSINGNVQMEGENAAIKVLQEIAQSLPSLFNAKHAIPEKIDRIYARCAANRGILYCQPITLTAAGVSCNASANVELSTDAMNGTMKIKIGNANIPILFSGPLSDPSWHPGTGFLEELRKLLP